MPSRESIVAGAALGAAKDLGLSETEQAMAVTLATQAARREEKESLIPKPGHQMPADSLDLPPKQTREPGQPDDLLPPQDRPRPRHKPAANPRREGPLLKLAHWLNLK